MDVDILISLLIFFCLFLGLLALVLLEALGQRLQDTAVQMYILFCWSLIIHCKSVPGAVMKTAETV